MAGLLASRYRALAQLGGHQAVEDIQVVRPLLVGLLEQGLRLAEVAAPQQVAGVRAFDRRRIGRERLRLLELRLGIRSLLLADVGHPQQGVDPRLLFLRELVALGVGEGLEQILHRLRLGQRAHPKGGQIERRGWVGRCP